MCSRINGFLVSCILCFVFLVRRSYAADYRYESCVEKQCDKGPGIKFPFYISGEQELFCGLFMVYCGSNGTGYPMIHLSDNEYVITEISYETRSFRVRNAAVDSIARSCLFDFRNVTTPQPSMSVVSSSSLHLLSRCAPEPPMQLDKYKVSCDNDTEDGWELAILGDDENLSSGIRVCDVDVVAPVDLRPVDGRNGGVADFEGLLRRGFALNWTSRDCTRCEQSGGHCGIDPRTNGFRCYCSYGFEYTICQYRKKKSNIFLFTALPIAVLLVILLVVFLVLCRKKRMKNPIRFMSRKFSKCSSKHDLEGGSVYFGVPVFSYAELEDVTNKFDASKELGDGGFGTVYYGKLRDGREVAVKRLYEHNYKRMAQFRNEVEILTRLRHPNLVSLYGCTSRRSKELLLVYEYIPNGTVADHLHGDRAKDQSLTWPVRMNIAIETAGALAYLHASDIIHRDVKTNNILLDHNFQVKVADFGLSRLFPNDVSHVSTAPQGTPGYVDPEYHQCYQLTDKSDVYSFGVVLIELISSMPAVDISRHRHEINLANLAVNRIQRQAFNELIDSSLGYESNPEIMRMTTSVAELAFRCLQLEKEMRPTMDEVLETLKAIQDCNENYVQETKETNVNTGAAADESIGRVNPASPESDIVVLLHKHTKFPTSPNSVTDIWVSGSSTTTTSSSR